MPKAMTKLWGRRHHDTQKQSDNIFCPQNWLLASVGYVFIEDFQSGSEQDNSKQIDAYELNHVGQQTIKCLCMSSSLKLDMEFEEVDD